ncbi:hypothetical protein KCP78_14960 [Salmonella enterica subsp. enterica]|nr:hypothetical protein KCP78_14960 [Salmonella enterica subsp. enterica]
MGITSAGMQSRILQIAEGHARTRTMRQFSRIQRFIISYHLHGLPPRKTNHKPKQRFNPAGSGDLKENVVCAFV